MKPIINLVKRIKLRRIVQVCLLAITFFVFGYGNYLQALAEDSTPDYSYQLELTAENIKERTHQSGEFLPNNALQNVEKAVDEARDKLNLKETTKEVNKQIQEKTK